MTPSRLWVAINELLQHIETQYAGTDAPVLQLAQRVQELRPKDLYEAMKSEAEA